MCLWFMCLPFSGLKFRYGFLAATCALSHGITRTLWFFSRQHDAGPMFFAMSNFVFVWFTSNLCAYCLDVFQRVMFLQLRHLRKENSDFAMKTDPFSVSNLLRWTRGTSDEEQEVHTPEPTLRLQLSLTSRSPSTTKKSFFDILATEISSRHGGKKNRKKSVSPSLGRWEIDFKALKILRKINAGGGGQIFQAKYASQMVAVKQLFAQIVNPDDLEELSNEVSTLSKLANHPNVVTLYGLCKHENDLYLVMEWCTTSLHEVLERNAAPERVSMGQLQCVSLLPLTSPSSNDSTSSSSSSESTEMATRRAAGLEQQEQVFMSYLMSLALQICAAMQFLNQNGVCHNDLKPLNVLIDHRGIAKLCDFGAAATSGGNNQRASDVSATVLPTTLPYMSPEQLRAVYSSANALSPSLSNRQPGKHVYDVWATGVLLCAMFTRNRPWDEAWARFKASEEHKTITGFYVQGMSEDEELALAVVHCQLRPILPPHIPKPLRDVVDACFEEDPFQRPDFVDLGRMMEAAVTESGWIVD